MMNSSSTLKGKGTAPLDTLDTIAGRPKVIEITLENVKNLIRSSSKKVNIQLTDPSKHTHAIAFVLVASPDCCVGEKWFGEGEDLNFGRSEWRAQSLSNIDAPSLCSGGTVPSATGIGLTLQSRYPKD
jgi:hypothetical protein